MVSRLFWWCCCCWWTVLAHSAVVLFFLFLESGLIAIDELWGQALDLISSLDISSSSSKTNLVFSFPLFHFFPLFFLLANNERGPCEEEVVHVAFCLLLLREIFGPLWLHFTSLFIYLLSTQANKEEGSSNCSSRIARGWAPIIFLFTLLHRAIIIIGAGSSTRDTFNCVSEWVIMRITDQTVFA